MEFGLLIVGLIAGPFVNFAIYAFAYMPRPISPWQTPPPGITPRGPSSKIPIWGWLTRRHEEATFGKYFWLRPLLIEVTSPIAMVALYRLILMGGNVPGPVSPEALMHHFLACALLIGLMAIATFIDFDELTIPDIITIPGTLLGLLGAVVFPDWRLYELIPPVFPALTGRAEMLHVCSPLDWDMAWSGSQGLWVGLLFWSGWCFGMSDRRWIQRRGSKKAVLYFFAALRRNPSTVYLIGLWLVGMIGLVWAYQTIGLARWESLMSSLFGIGLGGMLVWGFRLVARWAMQREALGFGDVTLMAMIGAFFGWQVVWIAFFAAPFFGMVFVLVNWLLTRDKLTPFGPYLCAATLFAILFWVDLWGYFSQLLSAGFYHGPLDLLVVLAIVLSLLGVMLWSVHKVQVLLFGDR